MTERRGDIVIFCSHGVSGERGDFVQRFRWAAEQGAWVAADTAGEKATFVGRPQPPYEDAEAVAGAVCAGRQHFNVYCPRCGRKVPMGGAGAQFALTRMWSAGFSTPTPLAALRHAYESIPKQMR